jgi:hypothetical protein
MTKKLSLSRLGTLAFLAALLSCAEIERTGMADEQSPNYAGGGGGEPAEQSSSSEQPAEQPKDQPSSSSQKKGEVSSSSSSSSLAASSWPYKGSLWNRNVPNSPGYYSAKSPFRVNDEDGASGAWFVYATNSTSSTALFNGYTESEMKMLLNEKDGLTPFMDSDGGFRMEFNGTGGDPNDPALLVLAFAWRFENESAEEGTPVDLTTKGTGLCITYKLTGDPIQMQNAWDIDTYGWDHFFVTLSATSGIVTKQFEWSEFTQTGWDEQYPDWTPQTAAEQALNFQFVLKVEGTEKNADFTLYDLGWYGECGNP